MGELCKRNAEVNCIIIGDGAPDYVSTFMMAANPLLESGKLQYYKNASQEQLACLYQKADLMLFPSRYEIFGMVLLEAVYFGLPVVTTRNGGSDVIEGDAMRGTVLRENDLEEWVISAETFLNRDKYAQGKLFSGDTSVSWDILSTKFIDCYGLL